MKLSLKSVFFCGLTGAVCAVGAAERPAPLVSVVKVAGVRQTVTKKYVGAISSIDEVSLVARVSGEIRKQCFSNGDMVKEGQLLFELEKTTYQAQRDAAAAKLKQCEAEHDYAKRNLERVITMRKSKATSESAYDEAVRMEASSKAALSAAKAALMEAENNLGYTMIHSPISGKASKAACSPFNYVTPASGALVTVVRQDAFYVNFWISARDYLEMFSGSYAELQKHADVRLKLADDSIYSAPEKIKIVFIDNKMDRNTDTILVRGLVKNPEGRLIANSLVTVLLARDEGREMPAVPLSAIINDGKRDYVYVVDAGNKVIRRTVESGELQGSIQVIRKGLAVGETVIAEGIHKTYPGGTVMPVPLATEKK